MHDGARKRMRTDCGAGLVLLLVYNIDQRGSFQSTCEVVICTQRNRVNRYMIHIKGCEKVIYIYTVIRVWWELDEASGEKWNKLCATVNELVVKPVLMQES